MVTAPCNARHHSCSRGSLVSLKRLGGDQTTNLELSMTNLSDWYEMFTREIYEALVNQDIVQNVDIQHNVIITGKSGADHQIDVYWEFNVGGVTYKNCIECKYWKSKVKKLHVSSFKGVLDDIGNASGVFVTTEGFQSGAITYAAHHGIKLVKVAPLLQSIAINMNFKTPIRSNFTIIQNAETTQFLVDNDLHKISFSVVTGPDLLKDNLGETLYDLNDLLNNGPSEEGHIEIQTPGAHIQTPHGLVPIGGIAFDLAYSTFAEEMTIDMEQQAKAVVHDIIDDTLTYVNKDGTTDTYSEE